MSGYDNTMASDKASDELKANLATSKPGLANRFKVNVSHLVNKCTFGAVGTAKPPVCPYGK